MSQFLQPISYPFPPSIHPISSLSLIHYVLTNLPATEPTEDNEADVHRASQKAARGEKTAENIRFGEAISEHGFGGETLGNTGSAKSNLAGKEGEGAGVSAGAGAGGRTRRSQGSFGEGMDSEERVRLERTRREMGYGEGSGVGG